MSFRMPNRGESFASNRLARLTKSEKQITLDFDIYYAGAILGLSARQRIPPEEYENEMGRELIRSYPKEREENAGTIAGMLVEAELSRQSIDHNNAEIIVRTIAEYLTSNSQTRLTQEGHRLLDRYAAAGFKLMGDRFMSFDYEEEFLCAYLNLLDEVCGWTTGTDS